MPSAEPKKRAPRKKPAAEPAVLATPENVQLVADTDLAQTAAVEQVEASCVGQASYVGQALEEDPTNDTTVNTGDEQPAKKKGRKPRVGKIVSKQTIQPPIIPPPSNIILHLKCSLDDLAEYNNQFSRLVTNPLEYNPEVPPEVENYDGKSQTFTSFYSKESDDKKATHLQVLYCANCHNNGVPNSSVNGNGNNAASLGNNPDDTANADLKEINGKLRTLKLQLYKNTINPDKKSACFWCTYDFDNMPCYIPKYEMDGTIFGYGSFCRPECAVAYLMKEPLDDSTKFERYHLLNQLYSKVYNCKKNIKPAPNPYYLLDKFYGNLSIQEYRKLLKSEHLLLVVDKPLTRVLPEVHDDNDDLATNIYGINKANNNTSVYKVKRQSEKTSGPSKSSIIRNKFGLE